MEFVEGVVGGQHLREGPKKNGLNTPTQPRVFVRFGNTKGEILVKKGNFRGDFFLRGLYLVWESATPPTHIWERFPRKNDFFGTFPYTFMPNLFPVAVDVKWSNWGSWTTCSKTCSGGRSSRQRSCTGGTSCSGASVEEKVCNSNTCPGISYTDMDMA